MLYVDKRIVKLLMTSGGYLEETGQSMQEFDILEPDLQYLATIKKGIETVLDTINLSMDLIKRDNALLVKTVPDVPKEA